MLAALATMLAATTSASAQILDLDDAPAFPSPPISVLDELAARVVVDPPPADLSTDAGIVESAGATLRRLIAELASRGRGSGDGESSGIAMPAR